MTRLRAVATALALAVFAGGCQLGERPTLEPVPAETADPATQAVLDALAATTTGRFTAEYSIRTPTGEETTATVVQDGPDHRQITIATTEFVTDGTATETCDTISGECRAGLDPQPISNLGVAPEFYAASAAARVRRDAAIRVGPTAATDETIAGQAATCVTVPVSDTSSVFCALADGPLARWRTTDVTIELTSYASA